MNEEEEEEEDDDDDDDDDDEEEEDETSLLVPCLATEFFKGTFFEVAVVSVALLAYDEDD